MKKRQSFITIPINYRVFRYLFILFCFCSLQMSARSFYIDPINGSMGNDGSYNYPWRTLEEVADAQYIQSYSYAPLPYNPDSSYLIIKNENAPVKPGDTLVLRSGKHGILFLRGYINPKFITIIAEEGQKPILEQIRLQACKNWRFKNITVSSEPYGSYLNYRLIFLETHGWHGPTSNISIQDCEIFSGEKPWETAEDWLSNVSDGIIIEGDSMLIENNYLKNVSMGISASGDHILARNNVIENFSADGMRMQGSDVIFEGNTIMNCYAVDDNHDDGIQSFIIGDGVFKNNIIRSNIILNYVDKNQKLLGALQGIGCFDGFYDNWLIENNLVVVNHWHGITLLGARNCVIRNNTVLDPTPDITPGGSWIMIDNHKDGRPSEGCVVANNVANTFHTIAETYNNVEMNTYDAYDANFSDYVHFDFKLKEGSELIDAGSSENAPGADLEGVIRPQGSGVDIGAYEYVNTTSHDYTHKSKITVFPNPSTDHITIKQLITPGIVEVYDLRGNILHQEKYTGASLQLDLHGFTQGVYWLKIKGVGDSVLYATRFIKL
ncbi:MAG: right-handed parallel beta-helix repeat-containing protein [Saprospiraceae bacterium]|nr:right-handed parallel beta-helix repeat-containing protein [Saprospiraceae bacterium]